MFGIISKKKLLEVAMELDRKEDTANARSKEDLFFKMGNANALNSVCSKFGLNLTEAIKASKKKKMEA